MRNLLSLIGLAGLTCGLLHGDGVKLGEQARELVARDCGDSLVRLSDYRQRKIPVLLARGRGSALTAEIRSDACRQMERLDVALVFSEGEAGERGWLLDAGQPATILIDASGFVRRIHVGQALTGARLAEFVSVWQEGKGVFEGSCARCHGPDGALDICNDVKPLTGIGNRFTAAEIRARLRIGELNEREVLIRGMFLKRHEVDAVIAYISGL